MLCLCVSHRSWAKSDKTSHLSFISYKSGDNWDCGKVWESLRPWCLYDINFDPSGYMVSCKFVSDDLNEVEDFIISNGGNSN